MIFLYALSMKTIATILTLLTLAACKAPLATTDIRALCTDTVNEYAHVRDAGDIERAKTLFTEDASVTIFGTTQQGREAILSAMQGRANGAVSRHMIGSVLVTPTGPTTAKGESYVIVVIGEDTKRPLPFSGNNLLAAGTYEDSFLIDDGRCKIESRNVIVDFQKQ